LILEEKRQIIRRTEILEFIAPAEGFEDVGGLENLKTWLRKRGDAWRDEARRYCLPFPKGLLIVGVPGCGKSLTAKCTSRAWDLPLLRLDIGRVFSSLLGDSEAHMRSALRTAEAIAPSILWIDEIEKGFGGASGPSLDSGTSLRVFGSFLTWMQEREYPVFVIATANSIERLPPEFMRKGRFDEIFFVDLPTFAERRQIVELHLRKRLLHPEVIGDLRLTDGLLDDLTARCTQYTGAEIEQVVITALFEAFAERRSLTAADLEYAIDATVPLARTQAEDVETLQAWAHQRRAVPATARLDLDADADAPRRPSHEVFG
jgi:SpoVK/Ycf46/Vps4 family AAA+-type ATPase